MSRDESGAVDKSMSGDGSAESGGEQLTRWHEVGELLHERRPELFARILAAMEATASELASSPEYIDDTYKN